MTPPAILEKISLQCGHQNFLQEKLCPS